MPFESELKCSKCQVTESIMWKKTHDNEFVCSDCYVKKEEQPPVEVKVEETSTNNTSSKTESSGQKIATRKSTRNTRHYKTRLNPYALPKPFTPKGKGRRFIFKKTCMKAPAAQATAVTSDYVFYKGNYFQIGDIVSMRDVEGGLYYAQIRGFITDQYCEKSCVISWLIPTQASPHPEEGFDPATYIIGPDEDLPRLLECMDFVMHAPSDYYKSRTTPYPPMNTDTTESSFIWVTMNPQNKSS